jgi:hypothetical protein
MTWTKDVVDYLLGDSIAFLNRYCSALTRERLAGADPSVVRQLLSRLADALPCAAHTTPTWSIPQQCIVAIGQPTFVANGESVTVRINPPYIGLAWDEAYGLFLWADPVTVKSSGSAEWHEWARGHDQKSGIRLRFGEPLTHGSAQQDLLAERAPLNAMLTELAKRIAHSEPPADKADIIDQARADIGELDEFEGQPREALDVIYPRLAARVSGKAEEEGMVPGGGRAPLSPTSKGTRTRTRGPASRRTSSESSAVAPPVSLDMACSLVAHSFPLSEVVTIAASTTPPLRASFLNLSFASARRKSLTELQGPGIYGIFFGPPDAERHLIYIGSYCGTQIDPFAGNVAAARWWKHAATLTMRGSNVSIARRTARWAERLADGDSFRDLADNPSVLAKAGCDAGLNRALFAHSNWHLLGEAEPEDLQSFFQIVYLRVTPANAKGAADLDIPGLLRCLLWAENELIRTLQPACNYQVSWGRARTDVNKEAFENEARAKLEPLISPRAPQAVTGARKPLPLTKSRFRLALECPTKLHYAANPERYPSNKAEDDLLQFLAEGGLQIGEYAKRLHPDGVEVTDHDHDAQLARTAELMQRHTVTIFEAAFAAGDLFIRADILRKQGQQLELIEVKAKSAPEGGKEGIVSKSGTAVRGPWMPYVQDLAFQTHVLRRAMPGLPIRSILMLADTRAVATVDGLHRRFRIERIDGRPKVIVSVDAAQEELGAPLLIELDLSDIVAQVMAGELVLPGVRGRWEACVQQLAQAWKEQRKFPPTIGGHCAACEYRIRDAAPPAWSGFVECWTEALNVTPEEVAGDTVLDLWKFQDKARLIDERRWRLSDVTDADLNLQIAAEGLSPSQRQRWQADGALPNGDAFYLDRALVGREMEKWTWPLHFIDFETARPALPFHKGKRPYGLVAFQFSHHVLEQDGTLRHAGEALLAEPGFNPNAEFLRALKATLGHAGTVFMWWHHERTVLKELLGELDTIQPPPPDKQELAAFIGTLLEGPRALYDLAKLAERAFFHPATKARSSIKAVLPAVLGSSNWLRERYGRPIYGAPGGIPSRNFTHFQWWRGTESGVEDPYRLLGGICPDLPEITDANEEAAIASGGAAAAAYSRLQAEDLLPQERQQLERALKRYCELDTLAMVMVVEAWREWCGLALPGNG